jgi:hypothetical protein
VFTEELLAQCRKSGDFRPVLFEWYKFVGILSNFLARIRGDSPGVRQIPAVHYAVLIGLLNRSARLMVANVALSHEGAFGETTAIVDRCIFESCVKLSWLCSGALADGFERFLAEGLKTELELEKEIKANIETRSGVVLGIERRMLGSIGRHIAAAGLTSEAIAASKKLPDMAAMIAALGHDRLMYVIGQRIGSHHVHGTWPSLRVHYLEADESGRLRPRDHDCSTHVNQFMFVPLAVLRAMHSFVAFAFTDADFSAAFSSLLQSTEEEIMRISNEIVGTDFEEAK